MKEQLKDFELKSEVMINEGGNSGIYFHIKYHEDGWFYDGHEAQINNTHGDPVKTGSLWAVVKLYESNALLSVTTSWSFVREFSREGLNWSPVPSLRRT
jgi:hypothetical protein